MKRFGRYNNDFMGLYESYSKVHSGGEGVVTLPVTYINEGTSFPEVETAKIFIQRPAGGADLKYFVDIVSVDSDDGASGTVITGKDGEKQVNIITTKGSVQVRIIDSAGMVEDDFISSIPPKYDVSNKELTIIQVEQV